MRSPANDQLTLVAADAPLRFSGFAYRTMTLVETGERVLLKIDGGLLNYWLSGMPPPSVEEVCDHFADMARIALAADATRLEAPTKPGGLRWIAVGPELLDVSYTEEEVE